MLTRTPVKRSNRKTNPVLIWLCAIVFLIPVVVPAANSDSMVPTVLGQNTTQPVTTNKDLDVILVMDSSGSMKKTDPKELRKPAAKLFISLLGAHDRAGVVSFSDQGYPVAWLTPVKGDKNQRYLFKGVDRISSKGAYTNLQGALDGALRVLTRATKHSTEKNNLSADKRQHVIVLMSDGKMDLGKQDKNQALTQELLDKTLPSLKKQGIEVHTIAFTSQSDQALLKNIAKATGGTFNIARTDKDLHDAYTAIFEQNKSPNILPFHGEKFTIDKAIKEVTIVGSKDSGQVVLSLLTPDGRMLTASDQGKELKWFTSDQFDLITITNPATGDWRLKASAGKNKAYVITDLKQELDITPHEPIINKGVLIKTWLVNKDTILNKPSILKSLSVEMHVVTPDSQTHVLKMEPELADNGTPTHSGAYTSLIALPKEGAYHFKVIASTNTFTREKDSIVHAVLPPQTTQTAPLPKQPPEPVAKPTLPPAPAQDSVPTATKHDETAVAKTAEPKHEAKPHEDKKPAPDHKKPSKTKETTHKTEPAKESQANTLTAVLIFVGINVVLGVIGGGVYFFIRKKQNKTTADQEDEDEPEQGKGNEQKDEAA